MKKLFFILLFAAAAKTVSGQIALESGLNLSNLAIKSGGITVKTGFKPGFGGGISFYTRLTAHLYFQPGIYYEMTGCNITSDPNGAENINTVRIPFNIEYKTGYKCGRRFFIGLGPYISYNLSGNNTVNSYSTPYGTIPSTSASLNIGSDNTDNIKAVDFGFGISAGYQIKQKLFLRARYQMGLVNLCPNGDSNNSIKTSEIGVTIGYQFGRCRTYSRRGSGGNPNHWRGMSKGKYSRHVQHTW